MSPVGDGVGTNGWNEWSRHVLNELKRLNDVVEDLRGEVSGLREQNAEQNTQTRADIAGLTVKSGLVGLLGGLFPALGVLIYFLIK